MSSATRGEARRSVQRKPSKPAELPSGVMQRANPGGLRGHWVAAGARQWQTGWGRTIKASACRPDSELREGGINWAWGGTPTSPSGGQWE